MRDYNIPQAILDHARRTGQIVRLREHYKTFSTRKVRLIQDTTKILQAKAYKENNIERLNELEEIENLLTEEMLKRC